VNREVYSIFTTSTLGDDYCVEFHLNSFLLTIYIQSHTYDKVKPTRRVVGNKTITKEGAPVSPRCVLTINLIILFCNHVSFIFTKYSDFLKFKNFFRFAWYQCNILVTIR
jgi:hypothetical protein